MFDEHNADHEQASGLWFFNMKFNGKGMRAMFEKGGVHHHSWQAAVLFFQRLGRTVRHIFLETKSQQYFTKSQFYSNSTEPMYSEFARIKTQAECSVDSPKI
jgi:hypothetical protein